MDIVWLMQQFAGKWPKGKGVPSKSPPVCKCFLPSKGPYCMGFQPICAYCNGVTPPDSMKGHNMTATTDEQWGADRNGLVKQSLIGEHMVRITIEHAYRYPNQEIPASTVYRVTIGMFWKYGNGSGNERYHEWISRRTFALGPLAWQYGVRLAKGATSQARND